MSTVIGIVFVLMIAVIILHKHVVNQKARAIRANAARNGQRLTRSQSKALAIEQLRSR